MKKIKMRKFIRIFVLAVMLSVSAVGAIATPSYAKKTLEQCGNLGTYGGARNGCYCMNGYEAWGDCRWV